MIKKTLIITACFLLYTSCTSKSSDAYLEQLLDSEQQLSKDILGIKDAYERISFARITTPGTMPPIRTLDDVIDLRYIAGSAPFIKDIVLASKNDLLVTNAVIDYMDSRQDAAVCYQDIISKTINFMDLYEERGNIKEEDRLIYNQNLIKEISDFTEGFDTYYLPILEKFEESRLSINSLIRTYNFPFPHDL